MQQYLQSLGDRDTHRGELRPDGTVTAVRHSVHPVQYLHNDPALHDTPTDPQQICPKCHHVSP
jgi:hypothetical protein